MCVVVEAAEYTINLPTLYEETEELFAQSKSWMN